MTEIKYISKSFQSLLSLSELVDSVGGLLLNRDFDGSSFSFVDVATDSRAVKSKTLFVPLIGEKQDGHNYVPQAISQGASAVFVSRNDDKIQSLVSENPHVAFILVTNTLTALQNAAERYVQKFPSLIKCSVTGSSGKTTTKEICVSILKQKYNVISNVGNLNSETGLPLSVFTIRPEHELGFFEMGMNRENEIGEISKVLKPNYGIVTNIGTAHIGLLGSRENIATEKKKIFNYVNDSGACIIPAADDFADFLAKDVKGRVIRYGINQDSSVEFVRDEGLEGTVFKVDGLEMRLALPGQYNFINALGAIELAKVLGVSAAQIKAGIESLKPLGGRSTLKKGRFTVLEDCYNANPDSMEKALEFVSSIHLNCKKILVLGDMFELGSESESAHSVAGSLAAQTGAACIVFVGDAMRFGYEAAVKALGSTQGVLVEYVGGKDDSAIKKVASIVLNFSSGGDFLLLKGSRGMGLERILPLLEQGL